MVNIWIVLGILFIHWFADFVLQTDWQAKNKSSNWKALLEHTFLYSIIWCILVVIYGIITNYSLKILWFPLITFICHTATDYFTSRLNTKLYNKNKIHEFFVSIGFDQWLHYLQLLLTYYYLTK